MAPNGTSVLRLGVVAGDVQTKKGKALKLDALLVTVRNSRVKKATYYCTVVYCTS
jgi:hypothetical protein